MLSDVTSIGEGASEGPSFCVVETELLLSWATDR